MEPLEYTTVLSWLKAQPPEVLAQLIADLQKTWSVPQNFTIQLNHVGSNFIATIKDLRELTGMGLREAKEAVDSVRGMHGAVSTGILGTQVELQRRVEQLHSYTDSTWTVVPEINASQSFPVAMA